MGTVRIVYWSVTVRRVGLGVINCERTTLAVGSNVWEVSSRECEFEESGRYYMWTFLYLIKYIFIFLSILNNLIGCEVDRIRVGTIRTRETMTTQNAIQSKCSADDFQYINHNCIIRELRYCTDQQHCGTAESKASAVAHGTVDRPHVFL